MDKPTKKEIWDLIERLDPWLRKQDHQLYPTDISSEPSLAGYIPAAPPEAVALFERVVHFFPGKFTCVETLVKDPDDVCLLHEKGGTFVVISELGRAAEMLDD
jgi:hypothetical protein